MPIAGGRYTGTSTVAAFSLSPRGILQVQPDLNSRFLCLDELQISIIVLYFPSPASPWSPVRAVLFIFPPFRRTELQVPASCPSFDCSMTNGVSSRACGMSQRRYRMVCVVPTNSPHFPNGPPGLDLALISAVGCVHRVRHQSDAWSSNRYAGRDLPLPDEHRARAG